MNRFQDKVVVTGGAHGIGPAAASRFAAEGARVAVLDGRDGEEAFLASGGASHITGQALVVDGGLLCHV